MTKIEEKKQLLDLATDFSGFIKKHGWISRYDTESDAFSITTPKLSDDARIQYFDNEIAFYITKNNKVEGVFIEYFRTNFMKHHKQSKKMDDVLEAFGKKPKKEEALIKIDIKQLDKISVDLEDAIKFSLASRLSLTPCV